MAAHPMMNPMHGLYGRDGYVGTHLPAVAEIRKPARVVHMRRSGNAVLLAINDNAVVSTMVVTSTDDPRLLTLTSNDRSRAHGALAAIGQEVRDAS